MRQARTETIRLAVIGDFQTGKSSLVNCLLGSERAWTGDGFRPETEEVAEYDFSPFLHIVDTPGFDDVRPGMEKTTIEAIHQSDAILFLKTERVLTDHDKGILGHAEHKALIVLFNCLGKDVRKRANPDLADNHNTCRLIEKELDNERLSDRLLPVAGHCVWPVNLLWAQYGLGLPLADEQVNDVESFIGCTLHMEGNDSTVRAEMLRRSGVLEVRDCLVDLPVRRLRDAIGHRVKTLNRICDQFAAELGKRWGIA